jgi:hypothetical protein
MVPGQLQNPQAANWIFMISRLQQNETDEGRYFRIHAGERIDTAVFIWDGHDESLKIMPGG